MKVRPEKRSSGHVVSLSMTSFHIGDPSYTGNNKSCGFQTLFYQGTLLTDKNLGETPVYKANTKLFYMELFSFKQSGVRVGTRHTLQKTQHFLPGGFWNLRALMRNV